MQRWRIGLGVVIGLACAAIVLVVVGNRQVQAPVQTNRGPVLSDCDGTIRDLVIHYVPDAERIVVPTYRDFLRQLPADVTVHVVCPQRGDFDALAAALGSVPCSLRPVIVSHPMTFWSRDRWLALGPSAGGPVTLWCPRGEEGAEIWPAREGDQRIGGDIAGALGPQVASIRSPLYFDGGDFVVDLRTAFVSPAVLRRNLQKTVRTRQELLDELGAALKREIVLLDQAPEHHVGMYMMPAGDGTVVVGDPAAGARLTSAPATAGRDPARSSLCPPEGPDFGEATRARFDAVARQCTAAGRRVVRIPVVPGRDGRTYVTYLNVIIDDRQGKRTVYMPTYRGADALNAAASRVWQDLGFEVRAVDCTDVYVHFGALHCLVNVLRRSP